jgi:deazaflavin-dependent oxidoreductase (nitroreductase family)
MSDWRSDPTGFNESVIREFRANHGVVGGELADMSLLLLTTIGARSGRPRTTPLAYHRRGHRYLVIASNGGSTRHPDWFRNLERNPIARVEVGVRAFPARATILEGSERDAVFEVIAAQAPAAARFQEKADRTIPVIKLDALAGRETSLPSRGGPTRTVDIVFKRLLAWIRRQPPDIGVREPRRPIPSASGGAAAIDPDDAQ